MESQHIEHEHPLVFNEELSNQREKAYCSRCLARISGPSFSCVECGFYLHKRCAEAPLEINHPFHRKHPLVLLPNPPEAYGYKYFCDFCSNYGNRFVYHCSCGLHFHVKCALFTFNIANKNFGVFEHIAQKDPLISMENKNEELESAKCYGCWTPLLDSIYFSVDCGFNLHKKCAELPLEVDCLCHRKHPLILQFTGKWFTCKICHETQLEGFVYCCSLCNFALHIQCVSSPPIVEVKCHQHPFTLLWKEVSFICNICGIEGNCIPYICSTCGLMVHKKCLSLPQAIKLAFHYHTIFRTYFLRQNEFKDCVCIICHQEVNTEHGSYCCSGCDFFVHVNCATGSYDWYYVVDLENEKDYFLRNEAREATMIKHFSHVHDLMLSDKIVDDDKCCDGCMLFISSSFFYCSRCDFFLHKSCAELPRKKVMWFHPATHAFILKLDCFFKCSWCFRVSNRFAYQCSQCKMTLCLRCAIPSAFKCEGHEHTLFFYRKYDGQCNGCGCDMNYGFQCKTCNFTLDDNCVGLPPKIRHNCDKYILILTYHDDNHYPQSHYCDICEEKRDPNHWFYHCKICDTSAHAKCVLDKYGFIKLGSSYEEGNHPHPLTFVKKKYYYPDCLVCCKPCQGLALQCLESECNYIVHWECVCPDTLKEFSYESHFSGSQRDIIGHDT